MTEQLLKELKEYIGNFDFDLIITSSKSTDMCLKEYLSDMQENV